MDEPSIAELRMIESTNDWTVENYDHKDSTYEKHTLIVFDLYNGPEFRTHVEWDVPTELILNDPEEYARLAQERVNRAKSDWLFAQEALDG